MGSYSWRGLGSMRRSRRCAGFYHQLAWQVLLGLWEVRLRRQLHSAQFHHLLERPSSLHASRRVYQLDLERDTGVPGL